MKKAFICFLFMFIVAGFLSAGPGYANPAREGRDDMHSGMDAMKEGRYEEAIEMFEKAYDNFKEADLSRGMGKALRKIGWANHVLSRYDEALENYKKALEIFSSEGSDDWKAFLLDDIGSVYFILGKYDDALKFHLEADDSGRFFRHISTAEMPASACRKA